LSSTPLSPIVVLHNAARLVALLQESGASVQYINVPSWQSNATIIKEACEQLSKSSFQDPKSSVIVLYNLDSAAYRAASSEGDFLPARKFGGKYHIEGDLVVTPKELYQKVLKTCVPLLQLHPDVRKVVLSPSPWYWLNRCCDDQEHVTNFTHPEYEDDLFSGFSNLRRVTKDFLFMNHVSKLRVVNPFLVFGDSSGRNPSPDVINLVRNIWGPDPVHPSLDCMYKLASFVLGQAIGEDDSSVASSSASTTSRTSNQGKRLRWATDTPSPVVSPHISGPRSRGRGPRGWSSGPRGGRGRGGYRGRGNCSCPGAADALCNFSLLFFPKLYVMCHLL
jgi:hypothetical protein